MPLVMPGVGDRAAEACSPVGHRRPNSGGAVLRIQCKGRKEPQVPIHAMVVEESGRCRS